MGGMVSVSELSSKRRKVEEAKDTDRLQPKREAVGYSSPFWGYTDMALPVDLTEPKLSFCQLRGTGQACISLVRMRVSEPQGKPNGVQV